MKRYNFLVLLMCVIFISTETTKTEDYCWRDYEGTIPSDALQVNEPNQHKRALYIGQVLFGGDKIIPGKIINNDSKIYFEFFDVEYSTDANIKIFCTTQPKKFEWISVRHTDVLRLPEKVLIKGGFEPKCSTYIGRVEISGEMLPGKVICCQNVADCYGLYTTNNSKGSMHTSFQILRYNENAASSVITTPQKLDKPQNSKCKQIVINLFN